MLWGKSLSLKILKPDWMCNCTDQWRLSAPKWTGPFAYISRRWVPFYQNLSPSARRSFLRWLQKKTNENKDKLTCSPFEEAQQRIWQRLQRSRHLSPAAIRWVIKRVNSHFKDQIPATFFANCHGINVVIPGHPAPLGQTLWVNCLAAAMLKVCSLRQTALIAREWVLPRLTVLAEPAPCAPPFSSPFSHKSRREKFLSTHKDQCPSPGASGLELFGGSEEDD